MADKSVSPSVIQNRLASYRKIVDAISRGLSGQPFHWTNGEFEAYRPKAYVMGFTLVTKTRIEKTGYRLKRGARPVGTAYFRSPISRDIDLYVLECQAVQVEELD